MLTEEAAQVLRSWLDALAAADPRGRRFGARHHRHARAAPLDEERVAAIERELGLRLPADYRALVTTIADGGDGPYHGLMPLDHPVQRACARGTFALTAPLDARATVADEARDPIYAGVLGLGHVGCGQVAFVVVRGEAAGEVWLDAREAGAGVGPIAPDVTAYLEAWIERASANQLPRALVAPGHCPLASALSAYLARREDALGLARGTIGGDALRAALGALPAGAIAVRASRATPFFASGDALDPCAACEVLLENLRGAGLAADAVAPGLPPIPSRGALQEPR